MTATWQWAWPLVTVTVTDTAWSRAGSRAASHRHASLRRTVARRRAARQSPCHHGAPGVAVGGAQSRITTLWLAAARRRGGPGVPTCHGAQVCGRLWQAPGPPGSGCVGASVCQVQSRIREWPESGLGLGAYGRAGVDPVLLFLDFNFNLISSESGKLTPEPFDLAWQSESASGLTH